MYMLNYQYKCPVLPSITSHPALFGFMVLSGGSNQWYLLSYGVWLSIILAAPNNEIFDISISAPSVLIDHKI